MALRWDLRPIFKNAPADSERATFTYRTVISGTLCIAAIIFVASWGLPVWQYLVIAAAIIFAFDAGDMRVPFDDDEHVQCAFCGTGLSSALMCWNFDCRPERFEREDASER